MKYLKNFNTLLEYEDTLILDIPNTSYILEKRIVKYTRLSKIPNNCIMYTSSDSQIVNPYRSSFGANMISNTYTNGIGLMIFDGGVTSIGNRTFDSCTSLTSINIPNSVTNIGEDAFYGCSSLTSIVIPDNVTNIGEDAFYGCSSLPIENNLRYADTYLVEAIDKTLSTYSIKRGTKWIGDEAFKDCSGLTAITIPNSVISIGRLGFSNCKNLTRIIIPTSVYSVRGGVFYNCSNLTDVQLSNNITSLPSYFFSGSYYGFFKGCSLIKSIILPDSISSLGNCTFSGCTLLTNLTLSNNLYTIGSKSFEYCRSLLEITIPNNVTSLPDYCFLSCLSLESITIGSSIKSISYYCFSGCTKLKNIIWNAKKCSDFKQTYSGDETSPFYPLKDQITTFTFGDNVEYIPGRLCVDLQNLHDITILDTVKEIASDAFYGCTSLTKTNYTGDIAGWCSIKFGSYSANPMYYSHNLYINDREIKDLVIPDGVTSIGNRTFLYFYSLTSITIPNSVTSIGDSAFCACDYLTSVTIPNSVISIGNYAFESCNALTSITIPDSVTSIGKSAFNWCDNLTSVIIGENVTSIGSSAFSACFDLTSVTMPNSVTSIGGQAFSGCSVTSVTLTAHSVEEFCKGKGNNLLYLANVNCNRQIQIDGEDVIEITIPNTVTSIESYAFYRCSSLTSITCESTTPPTLGSGNNLSNVTTVYVPAESVNDYKSATNWAYYAGKIQASYIPQTCSLLTITADNVIGNKTTTTIHWEALTSGVDFKGNTLENIRLSGTAISDEFDLNLSTTDTVQRTITYTYLGVTAETTITQGTWVNQLYTLDLNNLWELSTDQSNPDTSLYDGVYQSFSNYNTNNSTAEAYLTLIGYTDFKLYIRSNAESSYDYTTVSEVNSNIEKASTKSKQSSDLSINGYLKVTYTDLDPDVTNTITIKYKKDSSTHSGTDRGYLLIPRHL